ncbi:FecR family protein [Sphingomonas sp. R86521]|uniref:FecR family protein n=1 Tax=Sphingomonas sp. R86521 TaxID=3093860 RepID=UPI0036D253E4
MERTQTPSLTEQAATWLVALDGGKADLPAFEAWRDRDPRNAATFAQVAAVWTNLSDARSLASTDPIAPSQPAARLSRRHLLQAASVMGMVGVGLTGTRLWARSSATTAVGERRTILLREGTRLDLNTDTAVEWTDGADGARVWLNRGEIALDIARGDGALTTASVQAGLTPGRYNARVQGPTSTVLVLAGALSAPNATHVEAGQQLTAGVGKATITADVGDTARDRAAGWRRGEIVLSGQPLDAVLADYNRYLTRKLAIGDPSLRAIRIGGRFTSNDPDDFLAALHASFGITVRRQGSLTVLYSQPHKIVPA